MATTLHQSTLLFVLAITLVHPSAVWSNTLPIGNGLDNYLENTKAPGYVQFDPLAEDVPRRQYVQFDPLAEDVPRRQHVPAVYASGSTNKGALDTISTINVLSSGTLSPLNNITAKASPFAVTSATGSTAQCQQALRDCSLFSVEEAALDSVYQQAFSSMIQKQRLQYQDNLVRFRDFSINMLNRFIMTPDISMSGGGVCQGADTPVVIQRDPTSGLPDPNSIPSVTVPPLQKCVVSEWSAWGAPLAFGVIERKRAILQRGQCCPDDLVQRVNISSYINMNDHAFQDPDHVAENFNNDFINQQPRDILLVIDTSSSIFRDDFQTMKEGIKIMIDLFCGSFGLEAKNNRLAIIQFSTAAYVIHYFSDPQTPDALKTKVDSMVDFGGKTCTGDALLLAYNQVFQVSRGARPETPNDTLVVTDGRANCGADLLQSARTLQQNSKSVYALGIGIAGDVAARAQVTSLVTGEDPHHIFSLARYGDFKQMIDFIKYRQNGRTCTPLVPKTNK